jgi:hypothetical protein
MPGTKHQTLLIPQSEREEHDCSLAPLAGLKRGKASELGASKPGNRASTSILSTGPNMIWNLSRNLVLGTNLGHCSFEITLGMGI